VLLVEQDAQTIALFPLDSNILLHFALVSYCQKINTQELLSKVSRDLA
jgi:hypothetical protein